MLRSWGPGSEEEGAQSSSRELPSSCLNLGNSWRGFCTTEGPFRASRLAKTGWKTRQYPHLDGIKLFFDTFQPVNFWDTNNQEKKDFKQEAKYNEDDWLFYKKLRDTDPQSNPKRLTLHSGATGQYYNKDETGTSGGDGLFVLAPM